MNCESVDNLIDAILIGMFILGILIIGMGIGSYLEVQHWRKR